MLRCAPKAGFLALLLGVLPALDAAPFPDRWVWVFGWDLQRDADVAEITSVLETGAQHGINGALMSSGLDTLCRQSPDYFRRLDAVRQTCDRNRVEFIPAVFSVGYGGGALSHDRNLAEGLPVRNALFHVQDAEARFHPGAPLLWTNGGFEESSAQRLKGFNFHDQPGEISFADTEIRHGGSAALRLENFTANPHGHGRVMQELRVTPHRCYRMSLWVKTEGLAPGNAFRLFALAKDRELAPRTIALPATGDWRKVTLLFNSLAHESVRLYAGMWGGQTGKLWLDDWTVEEVGPLNVLRRPGTPVTVRSQDGAISYEEGKDFAPLVDPEFNFGNIDRPAASLRLLPGSRIRNGQALHVSWYHPMNLNDWQVTLCMAEPALYEIYDHEARLLAERVRPRRVMLNMDEVRMGGTCQACASRPMGELLGECVTRQVAILRKHLPDVQVCIWSDMLDPNHNAHGDYYLVRGDFTGSWQHVPKDLLIAVWGGEPREKSLRFFADQGFRTLVACYYDADDLTDVKAWLRLAEKTTGMQGFMYTPWQRKYDLLPAFGDLLRPAAPPLNK